jgi:trans-2-enoyl-CoA reductase
LIFLDVVKRVKQITNGAGAHAAIDAVGGILTKVTTKFGTLVVVLVFSWVLGFWLFMVLVFFTCMQDVAASVRDGGKVFVYGTLGGWDVTVSKLDLIRNVEIKYYRLTRWLERGNNKEKVMRDVMRYLEAGVLVPNSGKKFRLEDFRAAICESERDARGGKVLLVS